MVRLCSEIFVVKIVKGLAAVQREVRERMLDVLLQLFIQFGSLFFTFRENRIDVIICDGRTLKKSSSAKV